MAISSTTAVFASLSSFSGCMFSEKMNGRSANMSEKERLPLIECNSVTSRYPIQYTVEPGVKGLIKKAIRGMVPGRKRVDLNSDRFTALDSISLKIWPGDHIGLVGRNGAGKSTLLRHLAGIDSPDKGAIVRRGSVAALLNLTTGIKPDLSGLENIYLRGAILGLNRREVDEKLEAILDFCELGDFIYAPVRTYSSGMKARLGFAVSTNISPDVLLLDEVIGVGDERFRVKAGNIFEHARENSALVLATHQLGILEKYCNRCLWLDGGQLIMDGEAKEVIDAYKADALNTP